MSTLSECFPSRLHALKMQLTLRQSRQSIAFWKLIQRKLTLRADSSKLMKRVKLDISYEWF